MKPVAVFLNPPGQLVTMRDDICSSFSKVGYAWPAIDFICQSGYLDPHFELKSIDASTHGWSSDKTLDAVQAMKPRLVFSLVGSIRLEDDLVFLRDLASRTDAKIVVGGDWPQFHAAQFLDEMPGVLGVVTDFTAPGLRDAVLGHERPHHGFYTRRQHALTRKTGVFDYPIPRHDLFVDASYRMPFLGRSFASVLTAYGCPYACTFCNSGSIGFARREEEGLFRELDALRRAGFRSLYVKDFSFNADVPRSKRILREWLRRDYRFTWTGFLRGEKIDLELADLMRATGCKMAQIGIETANTRVLSAHKPAANLSAINDGVTALRSARVPFGAHFVFGLPGDDDNGYAQTLQWAKQAGLSYASFNVFKPRPGTKLENLTVRANDSRVIAAGVRARDAHRSFYRQPRSWWTAVRSSYRSGSLGSLATIAIRRIRWKGADAWVAS